MAINKARLEVEDAQVAHTLHEVRSCSVNLNRVREAESLFRQVLATWQLTSGMEHVEMTDTLDGLVSRLVLPIREARLGTEDV